MDLLCLLAAKNPHLLLKPLLHLLLKHLLHLLLKHRLHLLLAMPLLLHRLLAMPPLHLLPTKFQLLNEKAGLVPAFSFHICRQPNPAFWQATPIHSGLQFIALHNAPLASSGVLFFWLRWAAITCCIRL